MADRFTFIVLLLLSKYASAVKIGFIGDSGAQTSSSSTGFHAKAVYDLMSSKGVDFVIQNGDLDYLESPLTWENFVLARNLEVLVASGNHEEQSFYNYQWYGPQGYKARMKSLHDSTFTQFLSGSCSGEYGERYQCTIGNSFFVILGWAQTDSGEVEASNAFLVNALRSSNSAIKFCVWHRPEGKVNPGDTHTSNYGTQQLYETCRKYGAIITSGHCHVYGRTKLISDFTRDPVVSTNDAFSPTVSCGETVSFVVGMAGFKYDDDGPYALSSWIRTRYTRSTTPGAALRAGALICDTGSSPTSTSMSCEFVLTDSSNTVIESFTIFNNAGGTACVVPTASPTQQPINGPGQVVYPTTEDVEQAPFGYMYKSSSDLELLDDSGNGGEQVVGLRFANLELPSGANVLSSYIRFEADESNSGTVNLQIEGHLAANSPSFGFDFFYLNTLARTIAKVQWTVTETWTAGQTYQSPDVTAIVQEIVNQGGWTRGNDLTLIISRPPSASPTTNKRVAKSNNAGPGPQLVIDYSDGTSGATAGDKTYECFDDVEEQSDGTQDDTSSDLELAFDGNSQIVGMRFLAIEVPPNATIDSAFLTFQADEVGTDTPSLVISAQKAANAPQLLRTPFYLSGLTRTTATIQWTDEPSWQVGTYYTSPELKPIIQELIDQPAWSAFSSIVLLINAAPGTTGKRVAESIEGSGDAPTLTIRWSLASTSTAAPSESPTTSPTQPTSSPSEPPEPTGQPVGGGGQTTPSPTGTPTLDNSCFDEAATCLTYSGSNRAAECQEIAPTYCNLGIVLDRCPRTCNACVAMANCVDARPSMLNYANGCRAPCSELAEYCATNSDVRDRCQATCGVCTRRARLRQLQGGGVSEEITLSIAQPPESTRLPAQVVDPQMRKEKEEEGIDPAAYAGAGAAAVIIAVAIAFLIYRRSKTRQQNIARSSMTVKSVANADAEKRETVTTNPLFYQ